MNKSIFALLLVGMLTISSPTWSASSFNDVQQRAESGDAKAQLELGYRYFQGNETARDVEKALRWFQRAAQQGYSTLRNTRRRPGREYRSLRLSLHPYSNVLDGCQRHLRVALFFVLQALSGYQCLISDAPMSAIFLFRSSMVACVSVM